MRSILLTETFKASDVKPDDLLHRYWDLLEQDIRRFFLSAPLYAINCPACGTAHANTAFQKFGLGYVECGACGSLWVSPRPDAERVAAFYRDSETEIYWREQYSQLTGDKRREHIIEPRMDWIIDSIQEYLPAAHRIGDVGTNQVGFVEALAKLPRLESKLLIEPLLDADLYKSVPGIAVSEGGLNELPDASLDALLLFDVADRTVDLPEFIRQVRRVLVPNGLCFITTTLSSGFDIQVLWDQFPTLMPPDRLNVLSVEGWQVLTEANGFETLEFSTPGRFDTEVVVHALESNPNLPLPRFVRTLLKRRGAAEQDAFQAFLQTALLSSFGRILLRRR